MKNRFDDSIIMEKHKQYWGHDDTPLLIFILIAIYILVAHLIPTYLIVPVNIIGPSMESTLYQDDKVILYKQGNIDYGNIIVAYAPNLEEDVIKRVMGKPGDTVWFERVAEEDYFYFHRAHEINGMYVETILKDEYYTKKSDTGKTIYKDNYPANKITLADDEYYVMGDNRANSTDSRESYVGILSKSQIKGKALFLIRDGKLSLFNKIIY